MATKKVPAKKSSRRSTKTSSSRDTTTETMNMRSTAALAETTRTTSSSTGNEQDWRKRFFIPLVIVLLAVLAYVGLQQLVVATVNGVPISRITLLKEMESQIGDQVLDSLVTRQLIIQEAKNNNITVSEEEIDQEIASLKEQFSASGQDFEQLLQLQGMTMERVREEIRLQKVIEKSVGSDIEITDEEINAFVEENSAFLPEGQDTNDPQLREDVKEQLRQQKIGEKTNEWIEQLKADASIKYYGPFAQTEAPTPAPNIEVPPAEEMQVEEAPSSETSVTPAE